MHLQVVTTALLVFLLCPDGSISAPQLLGGLLGGGGSRRGGGGLLGGLTEGLTGGTGGGGLLGGLTEGLTGGNGGGLLGGLTEGLTGGTDGGLLGNLLGGSGLPVSNLPVPTDVLSGLPVSGLPVLSRKKRSPVLGGATSLLGGKVDSLGVSGLVDNLGLGDTLKKLALPEKLQVVDQLLKDPQVHSTLERSDANGALAGLQGLLSGLDLSKVLGRKKRSPLLGGATSSLGVSGLVDKLGLGDTLKKLALPEKLQVVDQLLKDPQVHSTLERADANGDLAGLQGLLSGLDLSKVLGVSIVELLCIYYIIYIEKVGGRQGGSSFLPQNMIPAREEYDKQLILLF
uniref:POU domain, class 4, transcription factor 1-like isoform X2 n=1 Tax=Podarcis muralis TaxID=64176 RepID=UPI00109F0587|nr:POU domain, class 4, transcription factor 1-like isoform X2 [Podarcis muralis]